MEEGTPGARSGLAQRLRITSWSGSRNCKQSLPTSSSHVTQIHSDITRSKLK